MESLNQLHDDSTLSAPWAQSELQSGLSGPRRWHRKFGSDSKISWYEQLPTRGIEWPVMSWLQSGMTGCDGMWCICPFKLKRDQS